MFGTIGRIHARGKTQSLVMTRYGAPPMNDGPTIAINMIGAIHTHFDIRDY